MSWETRGPKAATLLAAVALALLPACRGLPESIASSGKDAGSKPKTASPKRAASEHVYARHWVVSYRLDSRTIGSFARLSTSQRVGLARMTDRTWARWLLYAHDGRLLIRPPLRHPLGNVELLLADDTDSVTIFQPRRRLRYTVRRDRLPDLFDGVRASERTDFKATLEPVAVLAADREGIDRRVKLRAYRSEMSLRYIPRSGRARAWPLRLRLRLAVADDPWHWPFQQPLLHFGLPLLQARRGLLALEGLAWRAGGQPISWTLSVNNEGKPSGVNPSLVARVEDRGHVRLRLETFEEQRTGYRVSRVRPGARRAGAQLVPATQLVRLRHGLAGATPPAKAKQATLKQGLKLDNRSDHTAYIYIDGAQVGWVAPRETYTIKGLTAGYYRVFCVSPTLVRSWGPHDIYLPGPLTLR
jgi:hypothetical protein